SVVFNVLGKRRHGVDIRYPYLLAGKLIAIPAAAALVVTICNHDRGVPLAGLIIIFFLLFWTYVAKRTTFGRHVYAVGGNAEDARHARAASGGEDRALALLDQDLVGRALDALDRAVREADCQAAGGRLAEPEVQTRVLGREVARTGPYRSYLPMPRAVLDRDDGAG